MPKIKAFEAAIMADYDAQSAVEQELVLRLASVLWRLRRATTMETGLFEIQAEHLREFMQVVKLERTSPGYAEMSQRVQPTTCDRNQDLYPTTKRTQAIRAAPEP